YLAVPYEDVKVASYEERTSAQRYAEDFQANLQHPSFVKSMVRSHVYSCFWLGLPHNFCKNHLPAADLTMVLENEKGSEYESLYIGRKRGLSGGWRRFALDHKLDDGDALVFELTESDRFKVVPRFYVVYSHNYDYMIYIFGSFGMLYLISLVYTNFTEMTTHWKEICPFYT
ncbi:hypothetical protein IFM89_026608, partial [Coptis chinensis]